MAPTLFAHILRHTLSISYSELNKGTQRAVALCIPPLIQSIEMLLFEYPYSSGICMIKVSCIFKIQILSFMTPTLFVFI